jgi:hypothetical protein
MTTYIKANRSTFFGVVPACSIRCDDGIAWLGAVAVTVRVRCQLEAISFALTLTIEALFIGISRLVECLHGYLHVLGMKAQLLVANSHTIILMDSAFANDSSTVFGQCLRALNIVAVCQNI